MRLGQRVVQVENSHIILTGAGALNKVTYYTIMDFSAGEHDVICTRKTDIDLGSSFFKYHIIFDLP